MSAFSILLDGSARKDFAMDTGIAVDTTSGIATDAATDVAMDLKQAMRQRHTVRKLSLIHI